VGEETSFSFPDSSSPELPASGLLASSGLPSCRPRLHRIGFFFSPPYFVLPVYSASSCEAPAEDHWPGSRSYEVDRRTDSRWLVALLEILESSGPSLNPDKNRLRFPDQVRSIQSLRPIRVVRYCIPRSSRKMNRPPALPLLLEKPLPPMHDPSILYIPFSRAVRGYSP